jgi:putative transcriptional regulator
MAIGLPDSGGGRGSLRGQLLVATPGIGDSRFARTVVFICAHNDDHAMGLILNRPMGGLRLPDLLDQLGVPSSIKVPDRPVRAGGPMEQDRGFVLHTDDFYLEDATVRVTGHVALTATKEVLEAIASPQAPRDAVLALGYAGWGPGQLEEELKENAWLLVPARDDLVFGDALDAKWEGALAAIGIDPARLSSLSGRA